MQKYQSIITATNGSVIRNVPVTVLKEDGGLAEIFMDREGQVQAPNPLVTDSRGVFYFYAKNGRYSLRTAADGVQITDADTVLLFDPDETASDGPIADAVRRAEDAAERAETALGDSDLQNMVQDAQDAAANAVQAVIDANQAVASIDAALIEAGEAKEAAQAAAQTASEAAVDAQAVKDSLLDYGGALSAASEWSSVPAHVDLNLDAQAQALANRSELLRDNQKRTPLHFATLAEASVAAATLPDGQKLVVASDETRDGRETRYVVLNGLLVFSGLAADADSVQAGNRTQQEKNAEAISVKDHGAVGNGVANDTAAFAAAQADAAYPFVPDGTYVVDGSQIDVARLRGGVGAILKFTNGTAVSLGNAATERSLDQVYWQEFDPAPGTTLSRNATMQALGVCGESGFMSQNVYSTDGIWAPTSVIRFSEFPLGRQTDNWDITNNTGATPATAVVDLTGIGHGSGCSVIEEGGKRWLYSTVSSVGAPVDGPGCNYGTGFTKIEWKGSATTQADVTAFRGLKDVYSAEVCVSADGKLLVFAGYKFLPVIRENTSYYQTIPWVAVYERAAVESAVDPTTVDPLHSFKVPSLANGNLGYGVGATFAGIACDGRHIYTLYSGAQAVGQRSIMVFTLSGDLVKAMPYDGMASIAQREFRQGAGGKVCFAYEIEGLAFYKDALMTLTKINVCTPSAVVPYRGKQFIPTAASTNVTPSNFGSWARTEAVATTSEWNAGTTYAAPTGLVYHKYLTAIVPAVRYARPHGLTGGTYIDAPAATMLGFGDAGLLTSDNFYAARWDRQTETTFPLFEYRSSGFGRFYNADYMMANPGYDTTSYFGRLNYDYAEGTLISGGPSVATAATLQLCNARSSAVGDRYGVMYSQGGRAMLWGVSNISYKQFVPNVSGTLDLGAASFLWNNVRAANGTIVTSDRNLKQDFQEIDEKLKRVALACKGLICTYRMKAAVAIKGDKARVHIGVPAQDVVAAFEAEGLDAMRFGIVGYDSWDAEEEIRDDKTGEVVQHAREAGGSYSVRYDELGMFILAAI